jgi:hypothetical protein
MTHVSYTESRIPADWDANLTDADRALVLAAATWGQGYPWAWDDAPTVGTVGQFLSAWRDRLGPDWFARLRDAVDDGRQSRKIDRPGELPDPARMELRPRQAAAIDPSEARQRLLMMHHASARVELRRVHPSWCVRALREESPAVQRLVAASAARSIRDALQAGLLFDSQDLLSERPPASEVARWVMALWSERLVGGDSERADDTPAIIVLSRLSPRAGYRLCSITGLCKLILAGIDEGGDARASERARREWLEDRLAAVGGDTRELARRGVELSRSSGLRARRLRARIGLTTIARLLADSEPFRLRWALQHWPYAIAKLIRSLMAPAPIEPAALLIMESLVLRTAWERLRLEGLLAIEWPYAPGDDGSGSQ